MSITQPDHILSPFAQDGIRNEVPENANPVTGLAGFDLGFPPITMTPKVEGGIPPRGADFNGVFHATTSALQYLQSGIPYKYSQTFADAIGGYPLGAVVSDEDDEGVIWRSLVANNGTPPGGAEWVKDGSASSISANDGQGGASFKNVQEFISIALSSIGSAIIGFIQSGAGAIRRSVMDKLREQVSVLDYGADPTGATDSEPAFLAAIAYAAIIKAKVYAPAGAYLIGGSKYVNVLAGVTLCGDGPGTRLISEEGGKNANHVLVYLKDGATVRDLRLSGSSRIKQSGGADYICFNKIGVSTQGATANARSTVLRVGFERLTNSHVYAHGDTNGMEVRGCYTFGDQVGLYAEMDASGLVTNWNATADGVKLAAGMQAYCLTNFFNNASGTKDVTVADNKVTNINDSFVGHNSGASDIKVYGNTSVKNADGYYAGYGIDANGGSNLMAWGNRLQGHSYGAYIHAGSTDCRVFGNDLRGPHGVVFEDQSTSNNTATLNDITLMEFGSSGRGSGVTLFGATNNVFGENRISGGSSASATVTVTGASSNGGGLIRLKVVAHGRKRREIVKVTGVTGTTEANGVWEIAPVDADHIDLLRSIFTNAYVSGGSAQFGARGVTITKLGSSNSVGNRCDNSKIKDVSTGFLSPDANNTVEEFRTRFEGSVGTQFDGLGILKGRLTNISGISSGALPCNNMVGGVTISGSATTGSVVFVTAEPDANYRVQLTISATNGIPASGAYTPVSISKTSDGFTVTVQAAPGAGNTVNFNWLICR